MSPMNEFGQPIGPDLDGWRPPPAPPPTVLRGRYAVLEPLDGSRHAGSLYQVLASAPESLWTYMSFGPLRNVNEVRGLIDLLNSNPSSLPYAVMVNDEAVGFLAFLRIDAPNGSIEIGSIVFPPVVQRTTAATEAVYLLMQRAFDLGYRRCEWKCDDLNAPSRAAADRFGFRYEGTFRKATHYKGRSRDTAWYAVIDTDWPAVDAGFQRWLAPSNFNEAGQQLVPLRVVREGP